MGYLPRLLMCLAAFFAGYGMMALKRDVVAFVRERRRLRDLDRTLSVLLEAQFQATEEAMDAYRKSAARSALVLSGVQWPRNEKDETN